MMLTRPMLTNITASQSYNQQFSTSTIAGMEDDSGIALTHGIVAVQVADITILQSLRPYIMVRATGACLAITTLRCGFMCSEKKINYLLLHLFYCSSGLMCNEIK